MPAPDNNLEHLYPPFEALIVAALAEANRESAGKYDNINFKEWKMFEGYRSSAQQEAYYDQGRDDTQQTVTDTPIPGFHGFGIAADCVWYDTNGNPHWDGPGSLWEIWYHCGAQQGLEVGGRWNHIHDGPHMQAARPVIHSWRAAAKVFLATLGLTTPF